MGVVSRLTCPSREVYRARDTRLKRDVAIRRLALEPALVREPGQHRAAEGFLEHGGMVWGGGAEPAVGRERAVGQQHVQVGVPVGERAEGLRADDRAGGEVALAEAGLQVAAQRVVGDPAQAAKPAVVI
jgi:hypothetical protein